MDIVYGIICQDDDEIINVLLFVIYKETSTQMYTPF